MTSPDALSGVQPAQRTATGRPGPPGVLVLSVVKHRIPCALAALRL